MSGLWSKLRTWRDKVWWQELIPGGKWQSWQGLNWSCKVRSKNRHITPSNQRLTAIPIDVLIQYHGKGQHQKLWLAAALLPPFYSLMYWGGKSMDMSSFWMILSHCGGLASPFDTLIDQEIQQKLMKLNLTLKRACATDLRSENSVILLFCCEIESFWV